MRLADNLRHLRRGLAPLETLSGATLPQGYSYEWTGTALHENEAADQALRWFSRICFWSRVYESWAIPIPVLVSVQSAFRRTGGL